jgi:hypothetical protein
MFYCTVLISSGMCQCQIIECIYMNKQCIAQKFFSPNHQHIIQALVSNKLNKLTPVPMRVQTRREAREG